MKKWVVTIGMSLLSLSALAGDLDIYRFKTQHNPNAWKSASFHVQIRHTHRWDTTLEVTNYPCWVHPESWPGFSCKINGEWVWESNVTDVVALDLLRRHLFLRQVPLFNWEINGIRPLKQGFQFSLVNGDLDGDFYSIFIPMPNVQDDSMKCEILLPVGENVAQVESRKEFDQRLSVNDIEVHYCPPASSSRWTVER